MAKLEDFSGVRASNSTALVQGILADSQDSSFGVQSLPLLFSMDFITMTSSLT